MIEQEKINRVKLWGYGLGVVVFLVAMAWKFVVR